MIVLCSVPAVALWIGIRLMPESSRWYLAKERLYDAIGALKRVRNEEKDGRWPRSSWKWSRLTSRKKKSTLSARALATSWPLRGA